MTTVRSRASPTAGARTGRPRTGAAPGGRRARAIRINASTCKHGGRWRVLGPLSVEVSSKGRNDAGKPAGRDEVEGYGIVLPKLNKIPNPVGKFVVDRLIAKGVKYLQDNSLSCVFPARFRVSLAATARGTLVHGTKALALSPRQTETPRPGSRNVVEVWREMPESR